jgi:hypothetical protein
MAHLLRFAHPRSLVRRHDQIRLYSALLDEAVVHKRGDAGYGSREYLLLPPQVTLEQIKVDPKLILSSLFAHKNIVFGARVNPDFEMVEACSPLLKAALQDAADVGEQPQAVASLAGLCDFVVTCMETDDPVLAQLEDDTVGLEACKAMATGIPRPGHSVVGVGTFRDGQAGWEIFAREFVERDLAQEPNLYKEGGAQLVAVEHLADKSEAYMKTAGGAMCRLFFL